ncbi:MAG: YukJ family protein [Rickettsia endosymbiont of Labidopullus appendiculatus]|nr:YukJ family protein [Rickettsia endosymbiont of Labidopullus appendiculatus]
MLTNYSYLKGIVAQDLEDRTKHTETHHNLIVQANKLEYQVNIDTQSDSVPNVKLFYIDQFSNELLTNLDQLGDEGLFSLDHLTHAYRLDYLRSGIFQIDYLKNMQPKSWQEISTLLDTHITCGTKICILGKSYDATKLEQVTSYGFQLREANNQLPPRGIHDIHLNQGASEPHSKDNGIYQDGAIFIELLIIHSKVFSLCLITSL